MLSAGTERATLDVGRKGLIAKARARPDQARQVLERVRRDGVRLDARARSPEARGARPARLQRRRHRARGRAGGPRDLRPATGSRSPGAGSRTMPSCDVVPVASLREGAGGRGSAEEAAFATLGAIAMNGFRRAERPGSARPCRGDRPRAHRPARGENRDRRPAVGCWASTSSTDLVELAPTSSGTPSRLRGRTWTAPRAWEASADAVLVCASATESNDPAPRGRARTRPRPPWSSSAMCAWTLPRAPVLREGAGAAPLALVRTRPVRPQLRAPRARLPDRPRALDRAAQHGGLPAPGCRGQGAACPSSSPTASTSEARACL